MIIKIGSKEIGEGNLCFIIAEVGSNHNRNMNHPHPKWRDITE